MGKKVLLIGNAGIIITIALVFLGFGMAVRTGQYDLLVLAVRWPKSYCTNRYLNAKCDEPIHDDFSIHGLWPEYFISDGKDTDAVPPYSENKGCTDVAPVSKDNLKKKLLKMAKVLKEMRKYWSDAVHPTNDNSNFENWEYQWDKHGMCFNDSDQPQFYFQTAIVLLKSLNLLHTLSQAKPKIVPTDAKGYNGSAIQSTIEESLKVEPTIVCNEDKRLRLQLFEVHICHDRNLTLISCKKPFKHCPGLSSRLLRFPPAAAATTAA
ncbi:ribonuclease 1-like [Tripterygium wilfordii]|uniref:ribonuclease 1-like n=1 Tax=Tripterygium wilfordii TaxID=458696 RepID=UPI0018F80FCE|nr:ribonuclease 1-like [Tripterygium wilfordii]